jgi:hypothetical protein
MQKLRHIGVWVGVHHSRRAVISVICLDALPLNRRFHTFYDIPIIASSCGALAHRSIFIQDPKLIAVRDVIADVYFRMCSE